MNTVHLRALSTGGRIFFRGTHGMLAALTNESATSKSVYFARCTSEMIFITHVLTEQPEKLAGPLLADTYVIFLRGHRLWYEQMLAKGELSPDMGDSIKGKGMIQGVSAVGAFFELLSQPSLSVQHPGENKQVAPAGLYPILKRLYRILIKRELPGRDILQALRDETMNDPRERIKMAQSHAFYRSTAHLSLENHHDLVSLCILVEHK